MRQNKTLAARLSKILAKQRDSIWDYISRNHPNSTVLTPPLLACRFVLYPKLSLLWMLQKDCGYDLWTNSWRIQGMVFADPFFKAFTRDTPKGKCFTVEIDKEFDRAFIHVHYFRFVKDPVSGEEHAQAVDCLDQIFQP